MQFFVVALLVGLAAADTTDPAHQSRMAMLKKIMSADPKDMKACTTDTDCTGFMIEGKPTKCGMNFKLCRPAEWTELPMTDGTCTDDTTCKPMRRCMNGMCHFSGPKACTTSTDCLTGVTGLTYECTELPKSLPGMRCYPKCTTDDMCHFRMGDDFKTKIGCCGGYCQKKTACTM